LSFFTFYLGYKSIVLPDNSGFKIAYEVMQCVTCLLWLAFSIIDAGAFNGLIRVVKLINYGGGAAIFGFILGFLESLAYLASCGLGLYCMITFCSVKLF
jgi:hypothetical protein